MIAKRIIFGILLLSHYCSTIFYYTRIHLFFLALRDSSNYPTFSVILYSHVPGTSFFYKAWPPASSLFPWWYRFRPSHLSHHSLLLRMLLTHAVALYADNYPTYVQGISYNNQHETNRRPRWLGRWSACLSRSISWVQVSPSACS